MPYGPKSIFDISGVGSARIATELPHYTIKKPFPIKKKIVQMIFIGRDGKQERNFRFL
jgi:hypothetical protein